MAIGATAVQYGADGYQPKAKDNWREIVRDLHEVRTRHAMTERTEEETERTTTTSATDAYSAATGARSAAANVRSAATNARSAATNARNATVLLSQCKR
ncbi:hypothetical protein G5I_03722 [Acromyrmex echinatior]|uniref:Uncharacterized protein n=1 Tax=Acromyrmex echinatior TaxID=103372 RepID=F4WDR4_ACREC|nr:hypothetical protein G5I_03722 [Acromyrmex echinatior]